MSFLCDEGNSVFGKTMNRLFHIIQKCCHFSVTMRNIVLACRRKSSSSGEMNSPQTFAGDFVSSCQTNMSSFAAIVFGFFYTAVGIL